MSANLLERVTPGPWKARDYKTDDGNVWIDCNSWAHKGRGGCRGGTLAMALASGVGEQGSVAANAELISFAYDHALLLRAVELFAAVKDPPHGFMIRGRRYTYESLDAAGCPVLTPELREALRKAVGLQP